VSNVHEEITRHSKKQHEIVKKFIELEQMRESFIEQAISLAKENKPFDVSAINNVTKQINEHAKNGIVPTRKYVTEEMVKEYVNK